MPRPIDLSIIGKVFNNLKVIEYTNERNSYNRGLYRCECLLCGGERLATKANLIRGEIKDCGCSKARPKSPKTDLRGKKKGTLKVNEIVVVDGHMRYKCTCDCGNTVIVRPGDLKSNNNISCRVCANKNKYKKMCVDGTMPCKLNGDNIRSTNTSGITGVHWDKNRNLWKAEITFKSKRYNLGRYADKDLAIKARKKAEEELFGNFLEWYENVYKKEKADDK